jgi:hypothetical protein
MECKQNLDNTADDTATTGTYQHCHNYSHTSSANDEIRDDRIDDKMLSHLPPAPTSPTTGMQDLGGTNASGAECQERTCVCGILDSKRLFNKNSNEFRSITRTSKTSYHCT